MINRQALLSDLQALLRKLEEDLIARSDSDELPEVRDWLQAEYEKAKEAERTAQNYEDWLNDYVTQVAAAWVLSCVFVRFLEDNQLIDPPRIAGPGARLNRARDEHTLYFQDSERAKQTDREYLLTLFTEMSELPGAGDIFGEHNPIQELPNWLSGDAARALLSFFQRIDADATESNSLLHDFTDPEWDTRFLGDLYQDLSEKARKKYALLQTPDFVEEFILDRTLEPALDEFGLNAPAIENRRGEKITEEGFRMIDPACGSGHFLLGAFPRILKRWQQLEPSTNVRELVQRTLNSIHGVDINPFAIAIARFRLLLAALLASDVRRLLDAPAFEMNLACGDSLYHGRQRQLMLEGVETDESHYFRTEDAENLRRILQEGTFHAVVANPPYIVPKDRAANDTYRRLYPRTCHRQYSLAVPFMERIFRLSVRGQREPSGFTGQITANSFMKREFGKKLIETFFPSVDLSCVIDAQLAHIPGHGTPTVIIFGRNRDPIAESVRLIGAIAREDEEPAEPSQGLVWQSILKLMDRVSSQNDYVSVSDAQRSRFHSHPWSIGGGGASELKERLDQTTETRLDNIIDTISAGICITREDDAYLMDGATLSRYGVAGAFQIGAVQGEHVRDWACREYGSALFPYNDDLLPIDANHGRLVHKRLWPWRELLWRRRELGGDHRELGRTWWEWNRFLTHRFKEARGITYSEVATHNHFVFDQGGKVFTRTAPVVKLPTDATDDEFNSLVATLNSSVACFWLKQSCHCKGGGGIGGGIAAEAWERFYAFNGTKVKDFPILPIATGTVSRISEIGAADNFRMHLSNDADVRQLLADGNERKLASLSMQIRLQEDLDWQCYRLYGLLEDDLTYPGESLGIQLGERAFEIVLARKMARGEVQTTWFERHGSQPITELPSHWPDDYKQLVQRRIDIIESNPQIALIEQPEYKRRWNTESWDSQVQRALRSWLLDRLESYFDFDGRMNDEGHSTSQIDICLLSVARLTDIAARDPAFREVGSVFRDDFGFSVQNLIEELVGGETVPLLPILRYKAPGLRKRAEWEKTWDTQRLEDTLRAGENTDLSAYSLTEKQKESIRKWQQDVPLGQRADDRELDKILSIPVPPKYKSSDFISSGGARYWSLRGKLDVPKERWISFPHCEGEDGTLTICWAGYDHLQQATAIAAHYVRVKEEIGGAEDPRLIPLLGCLIELLPWLKQWHNEPNPEFDGLQMGDYYEGFISEEARSLPKTTTNEDGEEITTTGWTLDEIKAWQPPQRAPTRRKRRART